MTFSFNVTSKSVLTFDWSVSSEGASYDYIYYTIKKDGTTLDETVTSTKIGGTTYGTTEDALTYLEVMKELEAGSYELTFTYKKDSSDSKGTDTGYVKNIKLLEGAEIQTMIVPVGAMASTTHNIYGVYDMSGGAYDYVMGNIVSKNGTTMISGNSSSSNSGYTGIVFSGNANYTGTYSYPNSKYYDKYSFGTSRSQRIRSKLGDGIKEVYNTSDYGWYNDYSSLALSYDPWFYRGGYYYDGPNAGVFFAFSNYGFARTIFSSRLVITP